MNRRGFTLIEMLTTTAILVVVFALLAVLFSRATTIHKIVRSGGDSENLGVYFLNTIIYGHGINREEALVGARPFLYNGTTGTDTDLRFIDTNGNLVEYIIANNTLVHMVGTTQYDFMPTWAKDRNLQLLTDSDGTGGYLSEFLYYDTDLSLLKTPATPANPSYVGIRFTFKNTLQNMQEAVTMYQLVRIRDQIDF